MAKILLVDDNPKNIQVLANTLSKKEYEIEFAENGEEAIELIKDEPFDLILMDVMMPVMDGFEACKRIKAISDRADIPVIFLTAKTEAESISKGFEVGGVDYVTKPFNADEIIARVKTHIELKKSREVLQNMNAVLEKKVEERTLALNEANQKLNEANKELTLLDTAKNSFLNIISDELRTPLNGILGAMHLLQQHADTKDLANLIDIINGSVNRLESFTGQALKLTQLQTGKIQPNFVNVNLNDILESCFLSLSNRIMESEIKVNCSENVKEINFTADIDLIALTLCKVLENAISFSPQGSSIEINAEINQNDFTLQINGFNDDFTKVAAQSKFEIFTNEVNNISQNYGLDMALVFLIIEKHNGKIEFTDNSAEVGTMLITLKK
jgi:two-component system sensor histidine kinase/response regulator